MITVSITLKSGREFELTQEEAKELWAELNSMLTVYPSFSPSIFKGNDATWVVPPSVTPVSPGTPGTPSWHGPSDPSPDPYKVTCGAS